MPLGFISTVLIKLLSEVAIRGILWFWCAKHCHGWQPAGLMPCSTAPFSVFDVFFFFWWGGGGLQSMGAYSMWQGPDDNNNNKMCVALGTFSFILESEECFSFVLESEECECQQRSAMNRMGCTGEAGQTSKAWQFLRLHHSTWKRL